jgi:hypothetical protein
VRHNKGAVEQLEQLRLDLGEGGRIRQVVVGDAADFARFGAHRPAGLHQTAHAAGFLPRLEAHRRDLDDAVAQPRVEAGRFGIQDDDRGVVQRVFEKAHAQDPLATPLLCHEQPRPCIRALPYHTGARSVSPLRIGPFRSSLPNKQVRRCARVGR